MATRGRRSVYRPEYAELARKMFEGGAGWSDIAAACGVTRRALHDWLSAFPEFRTAARLGRDHARCPAPIRCVECGEPFNSKTAFNSHRLPGQPCRTPEQMTALGLRRTKFGFWRTRQTIDDLPNRGASKPINNPIGFERHHRIANNKGAAHGNG
jgi:hypothetical protein